MSFNRERFITVAGPTPFALKFFLIIFCTVYVVLGWLTFSFIFLLISAWEFQNGGGFSFSVIANEIVAYIYPGVFVLIGALVSGAGASALLFKKVGIEITARKPFIILSAAVAGSVLCTTFFLSIFLQKLVVQGKLFVSVSLFLSVVFGISGIFLPLYFIFISSFRKVVLSFLKTLSQIILEIPPIFFQAVAVAVIRVFFIVAAIGNGITILGLIIIPFIWFFPSLDIIFGAIIDAHPFLAYFVANSAIELIMVLLLIPLACLWFIFTSIFWSVFLRVFMVVTSYEWYRESAPAFLTGLRAGLARIRVIAEYAALFTPARIFFEGGASVVGKIGGSRHNLKFFATRFLIQALVIQKATPEEGMLNSIYFSIKYIPEILQKHVFFRRADTIFYFLVFMFGASATAFFGELLLWSPWITALVGLLIFLVFFLPLLFIFASINIAYRTFLYTWCLDQEFGKNQNPFIPIVVDAIFRQLHTQILVTSPPHMTELVGDFKPVSPVD